MCWFTIQDAYRFLVSLVRLGNLTNFFKKGNVLCTFTPSETPIYFRFLAGLGTVTNVLNRMQNICHLHLGGRLLLLKVKDETANKGQGWHTTGANKNTNFSFILETRKQGLKQIRFSYNLPLENTTTSGLGQDKKRESCGIVLALCTPLLGILKEEASVQGGKVKNKANTKFTHRGMRKFPWFKISSRWFWWTKISLSRQHALEVGLQCQFSP